MGQTLIVRSKGGGVELTSHGIELVKRGRSLLTLNDDIWRSLQAERPAGTVRLGVSEAFTRRCLPDILARFATTHPAVTVEISRAASCELVPKLKAGDLDLMLCEGGHEPRQWPAIEIWRGRLAWIIADEHGRHRDDPLPLSLGPGNCALRPPWLDECIWRGSAIRALDRAGRAYKIVSTSSSVTGQQAAVQAGLAISVAIPNALPEGLRAARADDGLPELPEVTLLLIKARDPRQPVTDALYAHIVETFDDKIHDV